MLACPSCSQPRPCVPSHIIQVFTPWMCRLCAGFKQHSPHRQCLNLATLPVACLLFKDLEAMPQCRDTFAFSSILQHKLTRALFFSFCCALQPVVNQIEFHPYLQQPELSAFHTTHGVLTSSYGPLTPLVHAKGGPLDPLLSELAKKHDKTPEQVGIKERRMVGVYKAWQLL